METFKGQGIIDFYKRFKDDRDCLEYLAQKKWSNGYTCRKCGCKKFTIRSKNLARDCNMCHHIESPTANTMFHKVKFGIHKAFGIIFEMSATTKSISAAQMSRRFEISYPTAWMFMHKVREAMASSEQYPMVGNIMVDEFVYGGKEDLKQGRSTDSKKKKIVGGIELDSKGGVKRAYFKVIKNYGSKELRKLFDHHISKEANVVTDEWTGYKPLSKEYNISQVKSNTRTFYQINTIIHQLKSWLRSVYSWMHEWHITRYLNEFSYRINRSQSKVNIFDNLISRMINNEHVGFKQIKISA